ncbi:hypothetical protein Tco_0929462, partial [Tanacetum coccineum]
DYPPGVNILSMGSRIEKPFLTTNLIVFSPGSDNVKSESGPFADQDSILNTLCLLKRSWAVMPIDASQSQLEIASEGIPIIQVLMKTCPPGFHERVESLLQCLPGCHERHKRFLETKHKPGFFPPDEGAAFVEVELEYGCVKSVNRRRQTGQAFSLDADKQKAIELEADESDDLDFSLTILTIGKAGVCKKSVLASAKKFTKKNPPDFVLYVDYLDTQSIEHNDFPLLKTITTSLGPAIWKSEKCELLWKVHASHVSTTSTPTRSTPRRSHKVRTVDAGTGSQDQESRNQLRRGTTYPNHSYDDLKKAFLEKYLQQKKCIKDPIELHNIKQRDGESTEDFVRRYKVESRVVKGTPECMRIFGFAHGITNPELIKRLHDKILKMADEMMRVNTSFLRGKWQPQITSERSRNHHGSSKRGINTDESIALKNKSKKMLKAGKLSYLIKELKQNSGKEQPKVAKKGKTSGKDKALTILMVQPWERVARQRIT